MWCCEFSLPGLSFQCCEMGCIFDLYTLAVVVTQGQRSLWLLSPVAGDTETWLVSLLFLCHTTLGLDVIERAEATTWWWAGS